MTLKIKNPNNISFTQFPIKSNILPPGVTTEIVAAKLFVQNSIALKVLKELNDKQKIPIFKEISKSDLEVGDLLGKGGTASVYRAKYQNKEVAFKLFHEGTNIQEWRHEVLVMSLVSHPNLVYLYGAGVEAHCPFIVMEIVSKGELYEVLHVSTDPVSPQDQLNWCLDIARGMEYLHSIGFVHRDLKSLNVLVRISFQPPFSSRFPLPSFPAFQLTDEITVNWR